VYGPCAALGHSVTGLSVPASGPVSHNSSGWVREALYSLPTMGRPDEACVSGQSQA
jgi:hypothetical protein